MEGRVSITVIVIFWFITMTWLVWTKVLPPLLLGEPPDYKTILADHQETPKPSAWTVSWNDQQLGMAASRLDRKKQMSRIHSFVKFDRLPLREIAPSLLRALAGTKLDELGEVEVQARSVLLIDSLGRLVGFDSRLKFGGVEVMQLYGEIDGSTLRLTVRSDQLGKQRVFEKRIGQDALLGDQLSPQDRLPGLRVGQQWTVPVYSLLRSLEFPVEIMHAKVEREDLLYIGGEKIPTLLVILRADPGSGDRQEKGRMWVDKNGTVLRQEMSLFGAKLRFDRVGEAQSSDIFKRLRSEWRGEVTGEATRVTRRRVRTRGSAGVAE